MSGLQAVGEQAQQKVQDPGSDARKYGAYQMEVYGAGMLHGLKPTVTKDPNKLEEEAKKVMSATSYCYVAGGAGERATMDANRLAFRQWKLVPRMLRPTTIRDMKVTIFGEEFPSPVFCAPVGVQSIFHPDGELGVSEMAAQIGVPYITSTASSYSIEQIAEANDKGATSGKAQRWYQLYWPQTEAITESLIARAKASGYTALIVTLDTWALAWRPWDLDHGYVPFIKGIGNQIGFSDPAFREHFKKLSGGKTPEEDIMGASRAWVGDVFSGAAHSWEQLAHVRKHWDGPILLKGIQHPEDAIKAHECGMDGVIVSNHGGRQCDGAVGSLDMLPEIVDAVRGMKTTGRPGSDDEFTVMFDSGIRTGVDVIKALALGAKAVCVGRPWVYGLGIGGKKGAQDVLRGILCDLDQSMGLAGIQNISECTPKILRRIQYPGDHHTSN